MYYMPYFLPDRSFFWMCWNVELTIKYKKLILLMLTTFEHQSQQLSYLKEKKNLSFHFPPPWVYMIICKLHMLTCFQLLKLISRLNSYCFDCISILCCGNSINYFLDLSTASPQIISSKKLELRAGLFVTFVMTYYQLIFFFSSPYC